MELLKRINARDFPGGPVAKALSFQSKGISSIPGPGTNIPHGIAKKFLNIFKREGKEVLRLWVLSVCMFANIFQLCLTDN